MATDVLLPDGVVCAATSTSALWQALLPAQSAGGSRRPLPRARQAATLHFVPADGGRQALLPAGMSCLDGQHAAGTQAPLLCAHRQASQHCCQHMH